MTARLTFLFLVALRAFACGCVTSEFESAKEAWKGSPAVFLGTVEVADPPDGEMFKPQFVRIRVDEAFKGVLKGELIEFHLMDSDCDAKFRIKERDVFYLAKGSGRDLWSLIPCQRSIASANPLGDDLLFLMGLPGSAAGTRLSGEVTADHFAGVANAKVKIAGAGGLTLNTLTNAAGAYEVFGLPPGTYSIRIEPPEGQRLDSSFVSGSPRHGPDETTIELTPDGNAGVDFLLKPDTQLSGRVLRPDGTPVHLFCVELDPADGGEANDAKSYSCPDANGLFKISMMLPGNYRLRLHDTVRVGQIQSTSTLYYPGVRDRQQAELIPVTTGKYLDKLDFQIPADELRHKVSGRFLFGDRAPVVSGTVTFISPAHGYSETVQTGADGSFLLTAVNGTEGDLRADLTVYKRDLESCPSYSIGP